MQTTLIAPGMAPGIVPIAVPQTRADKEQAIAMMSEAMRESIRRDKAAGRLTPQTVAKFASLHLTLDDGSNKPVTPAAHHWLWLTLACDLRIKKLLIISQPETAKTTWIVGGLVGAYIGFYPEHSVIIASVSGEVASKRSMMLRAMAETPSWQSTFPGVLPVSAREGFKWIETEWSLAPNGQPHAGRLHPTVFAVGRGGAVIGSRANVIIGDDLLDFDSTRTQGSRDTDARWVQTSLLTRAKARVGRQIFIGNAWHPEDYYARAEREGGWVVCKTRTLSDGPEVYATITYPDDWKYEMLGEPIGRAEV